MPGPARCPGRQRLTRAGRDDRWVRPDAWGRSHGVRTRVRSGHGRRAGGRDRTRTAAWTGGPPDAAFGVAQGGSSRTGPRPSASDPVRANEGPPPPSGARCRRHPVARPGLRAPGEVSVTMRTSRPSALPNASLVHSANQAGSTALVRPSRNGDAVACVAAALCASRSSFSTFSAYGRSVRPASVNCMPP